jgi:hypothetical protein
VEPPSGASVTLILNPASDATFREVVDRLFERYFATPDALEQAVRGRYPSAKVFEGVKDASGRPRWYVYRDGHWVNARA